MAEPPESLRLTERSLHLCVDMQRIFAPEGPWPTPWMTPVLPQCERLALHAPHRTVFTRFVTPRRPEDMPGAWRAYYERWRDMTRDELDPRLLELMPPLAALAPPALVLDKPVYSPFSGRRLPRLLAERRVDTLIVSGAETDVCVLATVLGAIDHGYFVVVARDALCSSSDQGHDALIGLFETRFSQQVAIAETEAILSAWPA